MIFNDFPTVSEATNEEVAQLVAEAFDDQSGADRLWRTIKAYESMLAANKAARDEANSRAMTCELVVAGLKKEVLLQLQARDLKKVQTQYGKISRRGNGGLQPLIGELSDLIPEKLPKQFQKIKVEINVEEIRRVLGEGEELSFVKLGERGEHVRLDV